MGFILRKNQRRRRSSKVVRVHRRRQALYSHPSALITRHAAPLEMPGAGAPSCACNHSRTLSPFLSRSTLCMLRRRRSARSRSNLLFESAQFRALECWLATEKNRYIILPAVAVSSRLAFPLRDFPYSRERKRTSPNKSGIYALQFRILAHAVAIPHPPCRSCTPLHRCHPYSALLRHSASPPTAPCARMSSVNCLYQTF